MLLKGQSKYSEKNISHCHFVHQKYHVDWPGFEAAPQRYRRLTTSFITWPNVVGLDPS